MNREIGGRGGVMPPLPPVTEPGLDSRAPPVNTRRWSGVNRESGGRAYMLNTRNEKINTVFYSYLAYFANIFSLNMYAFLSYTGLAR